MTAQAYRCLKCGKPFDEVATVTYYEYAGASAQQDFVSPCCRSMRYEELDDEPTLEQQTEKLGWIECHCGRKVSLEPRGQYDYLCSCGQRFNGVGQTLRTYCCSLDEQGIDCGHGKL